MTPDLLSLASRAACALPAALDRPLAAVLGAAWCALDGPKRRAVALNRTALGADFALVRPFTRSVHALIGWLRLLRLDRRAVARASTIEGLDAVVEAARARRGTVLVAAHVGEWEWGAAALAAQGLEVVAVAGTQMRAEWMPALVSAKARLGITIVGTDVSPVRLARALARGAVVALLVDGDVATARTPAVVLDRTVALPLGPARLAHRMRSRLVAGRCERDQSGTRYAIRLSPLDAESGPALGEPVLHARVAAWLTSVVREDPGAWCIFRPFFDSSVDAARTGDAPAPGRAAQAAA